MNINSFVQAYISPKGTVDRKTYLLGISLFFFCHSLEYFLFLRSSIVNYLLRSSKNSSGLIGLLDMFNENFHNTFGYVLVSLNIALIVLSLYIAYNATIKYSRHLSLPKWVGYTFATITCIFLWVVNYHYNLFDAYFWQVPDMKIIIPITLIIIAFSATIIFLLKKEKTQQADERTALIFLLANLIYFIISCLFLKYISGLIFTAFFFAFLCFYLYIFRTKDKSIIKVCIILFLFFITETIYIILFCFNAFPPGLMAYVNTIMELFENFTLLYMLIPAVVFATKEMKTTTQRKIFSNPTLNNLFAYKGELTSKEYFASILILLSCAGAYLFLYSKNYFVPEFRYFERGAQIFYIEYSPFNYLYYFVMLYSSVVISLKRVRTKSLPPIFGWLAGISLYFTLWGWSYFLKNTIYYSYINTSDYSVFLKALLITCTIFSIISIIYLTVKNEYDNKRQVADKGFSTSTYLLQVFWLRIVMCIFGTLLGIISLVNPPELFLGILKIIIGACYLIIMLSFLFKRSADAGVHYGWVIGLLVSVVFLAFTYHKTGYDIVFFMLNVMLFLQLLLVIASTKRKAI